MIPTEVFDAFAQGDYIPLMAQAAMENALSPRLLDRLFEDTGQRQFTRDLLFSSVVGLMSVVVCRVRPSINAAYQKGAVPIPVSLKAFYGKLARLEPPVGAALVRLTAGRLAPVITAMRGGIREKRNQFMKAKERIGIPMREDDRDRCSGATFLVNEMEFCAIDRRLELAEPVEQRLLLAPIVTLAPVVDQLSKISGTCSRFPISSLIS